ncbi:MAG: winged helix-turn-helix transcriptional regulator [Candidatus Aenigmarchaeota archaeon]|nr:winged helix-turn-helix transcriptional regulator [Candidatus Aenigmarchaeota archaeon]
MEEPVTIVDREVLKVLSADTRMDILKELSQGDRTPSDLGKRLKKSDATVVEHLEVLIKAGLVKKIEQPGKKWIFYTLTERGEGIVSSKSRRLVIILGTSLLSGAIGLGAFGKYALDQSMFYGAQSMTAAEKIAFPATQVTGIVTAQAPWLFYASIIFTIIAVAGISFYFYQKSRSVV